MLFPPKRALCGAPPFGVKPLTSPYKKKNGVITEMDILLRGIEPAAVKKYDELAKGQDISRTKFLANMLNNFAALEEFKEYQSQYETMIAKCLNVIEHNSNTEEKLLQCFED